MQPTQSTWTVHHAPMCRTEVRLRVLADHERLREGMRRLEQLSRAVVAGNDLAWGALRAAGEDFLAKLATHMRWEDLHLVPVLRETDSWGDVRCARFAEEHREQREVLEYAMGHLRDEDRPERLVAQDLLDLVEMLTVDMQEEEAVFLDADLMRDDVIAIDGMSG